MLAAPVGAAAAVLEGEVRPVESEAAPLPARVPVGAELEAARLPVLEALRRDDARCCADERPAVEPPLAQLCERAQNIRAISTPRGLPGRREREQCVQAHASWRVVMLFFSKSLMPCSVFRQSLQAFSWVVAVVLGQMHCLGR